MIAEAAPLACGLLGASTFAWLELEAGATGIFTLLSAQYFK
jgi:hypothetical protein